MKYGSRNVFKYIFILVVVLLIAGAIYFVYYNANSRKDSDDEEEVIDDSKNSEISVVDNLKMGVSNYDTMNPLLTQNKEIINIDKLIFEPLVNIISDYHA